MNAPVSAGLIGPGTRWRNWSRSEIATPAFLARAGSVSDVVQAVRFARERDLTIKTVGAGHSFSGIAATAGVRLDLSSLRGLLAVHGNLATVAAGTTLRDVSSLLEPHGLAMTNLGDIDRQSISGAVSTGTHGAGATYGGLATQVRAVTLVTAAGEILRISDSENPELLPAARLGLGSLGVLVDLTIECVPRFLLSAVEKPEPIESVLEAFAERNSSVDHFEFYVWPHTDVVLTKNNTRLPADHARKPLGPVKGWFDDRFMANGVYRATVSVGRAIPSLIPAINRISVRLTGNREFTDASAGVFTSERTVRFHEMEYAIPVSALPDAVRELRRLIDSRGWRISFPIEVRSAAADDNWLSTAFGADTGYIAVHRFFRENPDEYFRAVENLMIGFGGRPHWGKMHYRDTESLAGCYPRFPDFLAARDRLDPDRLFANPYLDRVLGE